MNDLTKKDTILVERDGEQIEVHNWVSFKRIERAVVRGSRMSEKFDSRPSVEDGEGYKKPEAVTTWVADDLSGNFGIDVEKLDIEVIDVESDEVTLL